MTCKRIEVIEAAGEEPTDTGRCFDGPYAKLQIRIERLEALVQQLLLDNEDLSMRIAIAPQTEDDFYG